MLETYKTFCDIGERLLSLGKFSGYILLALFVYWDFILKGAAEVSMADESLKSLAFNLFSARIIYTTIVLACLEAAGNLLAVLKP